MARSSISTVMPALVEHEAGHDGGDGSTRSEHALSRAVELT
jgi:hypothetical protein